MTLRLSVVLAVHGGVQRLPGVLATLEPQLREGVEVLVCFPEGEAQVIESCRAAPWSIPVSGPPQALTPHLWRDGILRARAPRVALSIVHCRPESDWIERLLAADLESHVGIGGAIDNDSDSDALGWAIYLLRYLPYARPFRARETTDLPGDNALYDRAALLAHAEAFEEGFWEPEVHARLAAQGRRLLLDPTLVTVHANGYGVREFARQRRAHGRRYGRDRAASLAGARRWIYALGAPAAPIILGLKVLARALRHPVARRHVARASPLLGLFLLAWGTGEAMGACEGLRRGRR